MAKQYQNLSNHGSSWSPVEMETVLHLFESGTTITDIANQLGRTSGAIERKLVAAGKLPDIHGWEADKQPTALPAPLSSSMRMLVGDFCQAYRQVYQSQYWSGRNVLLGKGNQEIIEEFASLEKFLQQLPPQQWEAYLQHAFKTDKYCRGNVRPAKLANSLHLAKFKTSLVIAANVVTTSKDWSHREDCNDDFFYCEE
jgi:hypothetical protein